MTDFDVKWQAISEESDLFKAARKDHVVAQVLVSCIRDFKHQKPNRRWNAKQISLHTMTQNVLTKNAGLRKRFVFMDGYTFGAIDYLLSGTPQSGSYDNEMRHRGEIQTLNDSLMDRSLRRDVLYGEETLHPKAFVGTGMSIRFTTAIRTRLIAELLGTITYDALHEHFDTEDSREARIYRITRDEDQFDDIWDEFETLRKMYQATAEHNEAVIIENGMVIH